MNHRLFSGILEEIDPKEKRQIRHQISYNLIHMAKDDIVSFRYERCIFINPSGFNYVYDTYDTYDTRVHLCDNCTIAIFNTTNGQLYRLRKLKTIVDQSDFDFPLTCGICGCNMIKESVLAKDSWVLYFKREGD